MSGDLEVDYLVVGAGAMGLAFVDTLVTETDATVAIVDRYDKPGGHWRVAYDFVRLHQPSDYYGVNSSPLGTGNIDADGHNQGLLELASLSELQHYFERVMTDQLLPSGRVHYFPNCDYTGDGTVRRIHSGTEFTVSVGKKVVDGTFMNVTVPSMVPPPFDTGDARVVPPGGLVRMSSGFDRYVVVGGGKTGIDTVLWLLGHDVDPAAISWVMPRDAWLYNREICQPGEEFIAISDAYGEAFGDAWSSATSVPELYDRFTKDEYLFRLSDEVRPTAFRCATVTRSELAALRSVQDVIRLGRVLSVSSNQVVMAEGSRDFDGSVLFVDCTANGLARKAAVPIFQPGLITLEPVVECQQVYSASFIAHMETRGDDDDVKNRYVQPIPHPEHELDYIRNSAIQFRSEALWWQDPDIVQWRQDARLAGVSTRVGTPLPPPGPARDKALVEGAEQWADLADRAERLLAVTTEGSLR